HRFQASKPMEPEIRAKIMAAGTPAEAKAMGKDRKLFTLRPDWEQVKESVMEGLVRKKVDDLGLRAELMATGGEEPIEGKWWKDDVWGMVKGPDGRWKGKNLLGKILTRIRAGFRK